jgi:hypothetical protein
MKHADQWDYRIEAKILQTEASVSLLDAIIIAGEISPITLKRVPTLSGWTSQPPPC